ncbi:hypothetical protein ACM73N_28060 [Pseudomonas aeruginosa]
MSIDWSKAPARATHYSPVRPGHAAAYWRMENGEPAECWVVLSNGELSHTPSDPSMSLETRGALVQRAWDGQGLPPVGIKCEFSLNLGSIGWAEGRVIGHDGVFAVISHKGEYYPRNEHGVRPICTPEQIAAEERSKECDRIFFILSNVKREGNRSDMAEAIYDAGYRRQEEGK